MRAYLCLFVLGICFQLSALDCSKDWFAYDLTVEKEGAFPDSHVTYYRYVIDLPPDATWGVHVNGEFPHGRYMGFATYDSDSKDVADSLFDREIEADDGSLNPFLGIRPNTSATGKYLVSVLPRSNAPAKNALRFPAQLPGKAKRVELWYRIYLPQTNRTGAVPLPTLTPFDLVSGNALDRCPRAHRVLVPARPPGFGSLRSLPPFAEDRRQMAFYRGAGSGQYPNGVTRYLVARLDFSDDRTMHLVRLRAPRVKPSSSGPAQARYWSFCLVSGLSTATTSCLADLETTADADGMVTLVVGPESERATVLARGMAFLPQAPGRTLPLLIYRNLLPESGFEGSFERVPAWPPATDISVQDAITSLRADQFLGEYAPRGERLTPAEFQSKYPLREPFEGLAANP